MPFSQAYGIGALNIFLNMKHVAMHSTITAQWLNWVEGSTEYSTYSSGFENF